MSNRRIEILKNAVSLRTLGGPPTDFLKNLLSPKCQFLGERRIERVESAPGNTNAVYIKDVGRPLYLPAEFGLHSLHRVLAEETYRWNWHYYQIPQTSVEKGDTVIDCGAAEGLFSLLASEAGAARVVCVEPHPTSVFALLRTFEGDNAVTVVGAALGDNVGTVSLSNAGMDSSIIEQTEGAIPVRVETIDHLTSSLGIQPSYIKADIEGYEEKMLLGAGETIAAYHPKLALTTYHRASAGEWMENFLRKVYPKYKIRRKGLASQHGATVMLHAWT